MMLALIALTVFVLLFTLSLCRVASRADEQTEAICEYLAQQQKDTIHPER